jgi:hypothetical protein
MIIILPILVPYPNEPSLQNPPACKGDTTKNWAWFNNVKKVEEAEIP